MGIAATRQCPSGSRRLSCVYVFFCFWQRHVGKRSRSREGAPIRGEELQFVGGSSNSWGKDPGRSSIRGEELQFVGKSPRSQFELQFVGGSPRSQLERQFVWGRAPGRSSIRGEELQFVGEEPQVAVHFVGRRANSWGRAPGHRFMCERSLGHRFLTRRGIMRFLFFWGLCDF